MKKTVAEFDSMRPKAKGRQVGTLSGKYRNISGRLSGITGYVYFVLGLLCAVVYGRTLSAPFYFDDYTFIVENPFIYSLTGIFDKELIARTAADEVLKNSIPARPVAYLSFAINYAIHQTAVNGYHLVNIVIHLVNTCLVYAFILLAYRCYSMRDSGSSVPAEGGCSAGWVAFFTAALYAVHPVMTSAVTYIIQRMASLATLFYLLTMVSYACCCLSRGKAVRAKWYLLSIAACFAALKSKEIAFTLPLMLTVFDGIFCSGSIRERFIKLAPFMLCAVAVFVIGGSGGPPLPIGSEKPSIQQVVAFAAQSPGKYLTTQFVTNSNATSIISMSPLEYLFTQFRVMVTYQRMLLVPVGLNLVHDYPFYRSISEPGVLLSLVFHLLILSSAVYLFRLSSTSSARDVFMLRLAVFGIAWFYLSLAMESGIIPMDDLLLDHRMYLPAFGYFVTVVTLLHLAAQRCKSGDMPLNVLLAVVILVFATLTVLRNEQWRDPLVFWQDSLAKAPNILRIHAYIGNVYFDRGDMPQALQEYKRAFSGNYPFWQDHVALGGMFFEKGFYRDAVDEYLAALKNSSDKPSVYSRLAEAYHMLGDEEHAERARKNARPE